MTEQPKKKRGGPQPGSGRPPKDPKDKMVKCPISMTQAHHAATEGDRSRIIRRALDWYPGDVDFCIVGKIYHIGFELSPYREGYDLKLEFVGGARWSQHVKEVDSSIKVGDTVKLCGFGDELSIEVLK